MGRAAPILIPRPRATRAPYSRAGDLIRQVFDTPAVSRAPDGALLVSLPVAGLLVAAVCLIGVDLVEVAAVVMTGAPL